MKSEFSEHLLDGDPLISAKPMSVSISTLHNSMDCLGNISSLDDQKGLQDMSWLQQTVNVNEIQGILVPENTDPNLLVNPQTGLPSSTTSSQVTQTNSLSPAIAITQGSQIGSLGNAIIHTPSNPSSDPVTSTLKFVSANPTVAVTTVANTPVNIPLTTIQQPAQQPTITYMHASPSTLHNIQNNTHSSAISSVTTYHQTLTQHLLQNSNNNHAQKLAKSRLDEKVYPKPVYSYSCLIAMALKNSDTGALPVSEIYSFMT